MSKKLYDITSVEDISKQLSTMSTISESDLDRKKKSKKKRNSFVQMDAPVDISTKKLKKASSRKKLKNNEREYSDEMDDNEVSDNVQSNDRIFPVSNDWEEEDTKYDMNEAQTLRQPKTIVQKITSGTVNLFDSKRSNFSYYLESNKRAILRCAPDTVINFNGVMSVRVLQGAVRVAGYTVTKKETLPIKVYSLNSYTYFPIELQSSDRNIVKKNKLTKALRDLNVSAENIQAIISCLEPEHCLLYIENPVEVSDGDKTLFHVLHSLNYSIPHLLPDKSHLQDLLEKHLGLRFLDPSAGNLAAPVLMQPPLWEQVFQQCVQDNQTARLVLCGGSGLGKTTLLRYLVNRCLRVWGCALVLDLDPGQAEFFLPGTLSATVVREPVLGPNFTQLARRTPERCHFLGDVKIHSSAHVYLELSSALLDHCHAQRGLAQMPWFVNTMGFVRDQGVPLACRIIRDTRPTHVIQIQGKKPDENFPADLTPAFVRTHAHQSAPKHAHQSEPKHAHQSEHKHAHQSDNKRDAPGVDSFELVRLESVKNKPFDSMNRCLKPADRRKLMLSAYFGALFSAPRDAYSVNLCTPCAALLHHLQVGVASPSGGRLSRGEILTAMNGELVALATGQQGHEAPQCLGYGIVYCIDPAARELFLLTPLPLARMARVKTLLLGAPALSLPRKFLNPRAKELLGLRVPYTCAGPGQVTSQTTSRSYRQPARNRQRAQ